MPSPLKRWRQERREAGFWQKARVRSTSMREADIINEVDLAVMTIGQAISRYRGRGTGSRESQLDQLFEVRMQLEACLGMMENILPD